MFNKTFTTSTLPLKNYYFNFDFDFQLKQKIWSYPKFDLTIHLINFYKNFFLIFKRAFIYLFIFKSFPNEIYKKERKSLLHIRKKYKF